MCTEYEVGGGGELRGGDQAEPVSREEQIKHTAGETQMEQPPAPLLSILPKRGEGSGYCVLWTEIGGRDHGRMNTWNAHTSGNSAK